MKSRMTKFSKIILIFSVGYLAVTTLIALYVHNYEFLIYAAGMAVLIPILLRLHLKYVFNHSILIGLFFLGVIHMLGGLWLIDGKVLYQHYIIQDLVRFDKFAHAFGIFYAALAVYYVLDHHLKSGKRDIIISIFTILIGLGIGALWEIVECIPVLTLTRNGVGGYFGTIGDLVADTVGAILAVVYVHLKTKQELHGNIN